MKETIQQTPTSLLRFGHASVDITPPVGIYHRMWGAASHDRATGVHRPLLGDVMVFEACDGAARMIRLQLDMVMLLASDHRALQTAVAACADTAIEDIEITYSHTHAGGVFLPDRHELPGGDLIPGYLDEVAVKLTAAAAEAIAAVQSSTISYATARCAMGANRDCWDAERGIQVTGFNPDEESQLEVTVGRVTDSTGQQTHTFVFYGCHPITLAWDNTLISPDYVGATRETVTQVTATPTIFLLGPCGETGPRHGYVGDTEIADRNGRQLAYAALSALESLGPPQQDFNYLGPVISGATLGSWGYKPMDDSHSRQAGRFTVVRDSVELENNVLPDTAGIQAKLDDWNRKTEAANAADRKQEVRDCRAHAERCRRWLARIADAPTNAHHKWHYTVFLCGDAIWVTVPGEPYTLIQTSLQSQFSENVVLVSPLCLGSLAAYALPREKYGLGLYPEEVTMLAPGALEDLIGAVAATIKESIGRRDSATDSGKVTDK